MIQLDFQSLIQQAYKNACDHGFHDKKYSFNHWLALVNSELYEALNAHRKDRVAKIDCFERSISQIEKPDNADFDFAFEVYIKDTVADELADTLIRVFDLCGLYDVEIDDHYSHVIIKSNSNTFSDYILCTDHLERDCILRCDEVGFDEGEKIANTLTCIVYSVLALCERENIDIKWHIENKMRYNSHRKTLHGCKY